MSDPSGYLLHGTAFSSKEAAFEILVHNYEQELRFHKLWDEDAQPYYFAQPQLTIPKSVADLLDKFIEFDFDDVGHEDWWIQENGLIEWFSKTPNCYIKDAYLVGKALGVDLVKVVEG